MIVDAKRGPDSSRRASDERGASLIIVLVIMMLGGLTVAALMAYAQTSLRAAKVYQTRTTQVQSASDAVDLALSEIRYDRALGRDGADPLVVNRGTTGEATCLPVPGVDSGVGSADREVTCIGSDSGRELVRVHVRFIDLNGAQPGAQVQVLQRTVGT